MRNLLRRLSRPRSLNSAGDTIVEVLIVLAVLGLAMSISYATANRGLQKSRTAQEHSQALGIINSQIELLRSAFAKQSGGAIETQAATGPFCLSVSGGNVVATAIPPTGPNAFNENINLDPLTAAEYQGPCRQENLYHISIVGRGGGVYDVRVRWEGLGKQGRQQEELTYKIGNVLITPTNGYTDAGIPPPPPLSGWLNVVVRAIPPAAGNNTPSCAAAATQSKAGTTVRLTNNTTGTLIGSRTTDTTSTAAFTGIQQGDTFTASVSRPDFGVCPGSSTGVASTTAPVPVISKTIYPICRTITSTTYGWVWGNRRADLDGYYGTIPPSVPNGTYPNPYGHIYAGNVRAGGTFVYAWAGINNPNDSYYQGQGFLYYYLWEVSWAPVSTTSTNYCPS